ncbi:hypothetical protein V495_00811, partial [Pseudogymnoascus sp. VKM F-4514 (FW-929)]
MGSFRSSAPDLNNKDGFLSDFMAGGKQNRRKSGTIQRCAFGEGCRKVVTSKNMGVVPMPRPSDFCEIHTCIGFQGEAPCFNKVIKSGVTRCVIHYQCTVTGCSEQRVGSPNGGWWDCCAHHQCDADGCYSPRKYNVLKGRHFVYCPKHKCVREGCERSHPSWQQYCTTHTCVKAGCGDIVEGDEKLCTRHMKCSHNSCPSNRVRKDGEYQPFCARHSTCTSSQCTREKKPGSEFCSLQNAASLINATAVTIPANSTCAATPEHSTWKAAASRSHATVSSMNAENQVAISVPATKLMATAEHITAKFRVAITSEWSIQTATTHPSPCVES